MYKHLSDFDAHALVTSRHEEASGLSAIIAIHNENLGPAIGGCRILNYPSPEAALVDVLRLSKGMTYKAAIAGIPYGGGKAVIIADPQREKSTKLLHAVGEFVQSLGGRYITSFDTGSTLDDVRIIAEKTDYTAGTLAEAGDASGSTAAGIYYCMRAASELRHGRADLAGMRVAIQGVGNVGYRLASRLAQDGASLVIADTDEELAARISEELGAQCVAVEEILQIDADIFSPCALGAVLNRESIPLLKARIVVGGANNQLATPGDDARLRAADILYCPDYLSNAGGIIDLHYQRSGWCREAVDRHIAGLANTFREVAERSRVTGVGTSAITNRIAEERYDAGPGRA